MVLGWPSALDEGRELGLGLGRLRSQLELSEAESRRVLVKNPMLLGQSYEAQLLPMCEATQARTVHACAWRVHGVCMRVHGVCMACAWRVHGVCMACAWRVHGVCMALHAVCNTSVGGESQIGRGRVHSYAHHGSDYASVTMPGAARAE